MIMSSQERKFRLEDIRFNPNPPPVKGGREFSKGPEEAFKKIEDIFSHYVLGNIDFEHAEKALMYAKNAIIPRQKYPKEVIEELKKLYEEAIRILRRLRTREKVKEWLLSHGPPRRETATLEEFFTS